MVEERSAHVFACFKNSSPVAFLEVVDDGESFASEPHGVKNICGAFCLPEYRENWIVTYKAIPFTSYHVPFIRRVFAQNIGVLHGSPISVDEWRQCLFDEPDPHEENFIITADSKNSAWLKLNGLSKSEICISMLVVAKEYQHKGVGSFAIQFTEGYAKKLQKSAVVIQTTKDNIVAMPSRNIMKE